MRDGTSPTSFEVALNDEATFVDLSHAISETTPPWPGNLPFSRDRVGSYADGALASFDVKLSEHTGTHVDAPRHAYADGLSVAELPLKALIAPLVVVGAEDAGVADGVVGPAELERHESRYGRIAARSVVALHTGWSRRWPERYFLLDHAGVAHYPSVSADVASGLIERGVAAIGIDTPSVDPGGAAPPEVHAIVLGSGAYLIENLTRLEMLPPTGAWVLTSPLSLDGGTGSPARVVGVIGGPR